MTSTPQAGVSHPTLPGIELVDPDIYERGGIPHEALATLRAEAPVYRHHGDPIKGNLPFWAVTRHEDVVHVSRHPELFSSWEQSALFDEIPQEQLEMTRLMMLNQDPPEHSKKRSIVNRGFTPRAIGALEEHIREICRDLVGDVARRLEAGGEADF
ncbi:cytochrome P450, partial [Actinomadura adrarensis]